MPAAERLAWLKKIRPKCSLSGNTSSCIGREGAPGGAAGVDEVDAGQLVGAGHLLRPQVLLDRDRVVGASLDSGVVGHHHAVASLNPPDAGDDAGSGYRVVVHPVPREGTELEERAAGIEQRVDPV